MKIPGRLRPAALRLARRDMQRHPLRTTLATLIIALPVTALVGVAALTQSGPPSTDTALAGIPEGAQAVITTTAVTRDGTPFPQLPEGAPAPWMDDLDQVPASEQELAEIIPDPDSLLQYWNSPTLLVTTGLGVEPGQTSAAGESVENLNTAQVTSATMVEAEPEALIMLLPKLAKGAAPTDDTEIVITTALAERLGVGIGDTLVWVAPPFTGWYSTDGRIGEVIQDSQHGYRVSGLVSDDAQKGWTLEGWLAPMVAADPAGVDGHWLVAGDAPVTWAMALEMNKLQAFAVSRSVLEDLPEEDELYPVRIDAAAAMAQAGGVVVTGVVGMVLALLLITPAFAVSAEQSRRTLGLAAAAGATPRDLRRTLTAQGTGIGLAGGVLGVVLGAALSAAVAALAASGNSSLNPIDRFPVPVAIAGVVVAVLVGLVATHGPARRASAFDVIDALKDRPTPAPSSRARKATMVTAIILVGAAVATVAGALALAQPTDGYVTPGTVPTESVPALALLVLGLLCGFAGLLLTVRSLTAVAGRIAGALPTLWRLALRDAADHRARFVPAVSAVLITVIAASALIVVIGSATANDRDRNSEMVTANGIILGTKVPVSENFDKLVTTGAIDALAQKLPVTGSEQIHTTALNGTRFLGVLPPEGQDCPEGQDADTYSATHLGTAITCVDQERAYSPSLSVAWWGGTNTYVLSPAAVRASRLDGADEAARVLEAGGVIVNNAARIDSDGRVRVAVGTNFLPSEQDAERIVTLPAAFLRGYAPILTVSAETARELGITETDYVGEYVLTSRPLSLEETATGQALLSQNDSLAWMGQANNPRPWGHDEALLPLAVLALLGVLATAITLALARSQGARDAATMHAIGATPSFLRRFGLAQGTTVLVIAVPLGLVSGLAIGTALVTWYRKAQSGGAWLETVPLWTLQGALVVVIGAAALLAAMVIARPPRNLVRRAID